MQKRGAAGAVRYKDIRFEEVFEVKRSSRLASGNLNGVGQVRVVPKRSKLSKRMK